MRIQNVHCDVTGYCGLCNGFVFLMVLYSSTTLAMFHTYTYNSIDLVQVLGDFLTVLCS